MAGRDRNVFECVRDVNWITFGTLMFLLAMSKVNENQIDSDSFHSSIVQRNSIAHSEAVISALTSRSSTSMNRFINSQTDQVTRINAFFSSFIKK
jgi:hypothetical protein